MRPPAVRSAVAMLALASVMTTVPAAAQNAAAAEALFNKGLTALKGEDYETACPLLEESHRLDPKPGVLFTLAACEQKRGRLATAVTRYEDYLEIVAALPPAQRTRQQARERAARRERDALKGQVPTLTVVLPASAPATVTVKRDGEGMGRPTLGLALPVDPGEHVVTVSAGDEVLHTTRVTLAVGESRTVTLPATYKISKPNGGGGGGEGGGGGSQTTPPDETVQDDRMSIAWPVAAFAVGAVGVGVGTLFGVLALGKKSVVDDECDGKTCRSDEGKSAGETGRTFAAVSTFGFVAGGIGLATGVTLLLLRGSDKKPGSTGSGSPAGAGVRVTPEWSVSPSFVGVGASGRF